MAIGRTEDRDIPGNPTMLRHRDYVRDPHPRNPSGPAVKPTALTGRTHDRNRPDPTQLQNSLRTGGRPHMDSGFRLLDGRGMTTNQAPTVGIEPPTQPARKTMMYQ